MNRRLVVVALLLAAACGSTPTRHPTTSQGLPFPRLASYRIESSLDDQARSALERIPLGVVDAEWARSIRVGWPRSGAAIPRCSCSHT